MDLFTIELVSGATSQLFPNNTLSSITNFLPEQVTLVGQWQVAIPEILTHQCTKTLERGNLCFMMTDNPKSTEDYYLEFGLYSSINDIVEALNTLIQQRINHKDTIFTIKASR